MEDFSSVRGENSLVESLLAWFRWTARDLPWRRTYDPYHVWISEIMLQQTQMDRGVVYFKRWITRFPTPRDLARADLQEVLKYWEGLGYYARARNLHKAAQLIVEKFYGCVPCNYEQLLSLPGIGPYTAAAIASIAGNENVAVIDANVTRVYARLIDLAAPIRASQTVKRIAEIARILLPQGRARLYNQALMDLGGLVCLPKNPRCPICPIAAFCRALQAGTVGERPALGQGKKMSTLQRLTGVIDHGGRIYVQQRRPEDLWGGLWEFPGGDSGGLAPEEELAQHILAETGFTVQVGQSITTVIHHYTRYKIVLQAFSCRLLGETTQPRLRSAVDFRWLLPVEFGSYAFPAGPRKILEYLEKEEGVGF